MNLIYKTLCIIIDFVQLTPLKIMQFDYRLWSFTKEVRGSISLSILIGITATFLGVIRLALLGWLIGLIFLGHSLYPSIAE